jgi:hypothetical protein
VQRARAASGGDVVDVERSSRLHGRASYISVTAAKRLDAQVQNSTPITSRASLSASPSPPRRLFLRAPISLPPCRLTAYPSQRPPSHNTPCLARAPPTRPNTHHTTPPHRTMSRMQDQFVDDDEEECCPLCVEEFDLSDRNFRPCPCGYQVCYIAAPMQPRRAAVLTLARYASSATTTSRPR